jgi:hypothetical protein
MVQAIKVRLPDGRTVSPSDWTSAPLFSTVEVSNAANLQPLPAFSYGETGIVPGSVGPRNATQADTNMQGQGGILQENEEVFLYALQIEVTQVVASTANFFTNNELFAPDPPEVSLTNMLRLQRSTLVRTKIANTKDYGVNPISFYGAAMGVHRTTAATRAQNANSTYTNGVAIGSHGGVNVYDQREIATPHHVGPGEAFEVTLEFPYGSVVEPLPVTAGQVVASPLNFGTDNDARLRVRIYVVGPRRRPVA